LNLHARPEYGAHNRCGFITPSDGSRDVFVHVSAVDRSGMSALKAGQRVTYDVVTAGDDLLAANLRDA
jgi:CspA family cold shock protein